MFRPEEFFDIGGLSNREIFLPGEYVWKALDHLQEYLESFFQDPWPLARINGLVRKPLAVCGGSVVELKEADVVGFKGEIRDVRGEALRGAALILPGAYLTDGRIILGAGSVVEPGAMLKGPTVIGRNSEVRQGAYVRGNCLVGDGCVVGHATEIKGSIMLDGAKAGHFAYIGDSILGREVNLGAGTKLANLKMMPGTVAIRSGNERYDTGRRKLGAVLGDRTELGCNSVTSPGTLLGPGSVVYPAVGVPGGHYPAKTCFMPSKDSLQIRSLDYSG